MKKIDENKIAFKIGKVLSEHLFYEALFENKADYIKNHSQKDKLWEIPLYKEDISMMVRDIMEVVRND